MLVGDDKEIFEFTIKKIGSKTVKDFLNEIRLKDKNNSFGYSKKYTALHHKIYNEIEKAKDTKTRFYLANFLSRAERYAKTLKNPSLATCKKLIAESESETHKPTISHYRDIENGIKSALARLRKSNFSISKLSDNQYIVRDKMLNQSQVLTESGVISLAKNPKRKANCLVPKVARKTTVKTTVNPSASAKGLVALRNKVRLRTGNGARPVALESFTNAEQERILNNAKYFEVSGGYVYLVKKTRRNPISKTVKNSNSFILIESTTNHHKRDFEQDVRRWQEIAKSVNLTSKEIKAQFIPSKHKEIGSYRIYITQKLDDKLQNNPTRQNYDEHAIFETHIDETLDNNAALFHGKITGKVIKTVGSDYTNSRVTRLGKLHSFIVITDDNQKVEINPSSDAFLSMDIRRNLQFDGKGVQFPKNLRPRTNTLTLIGKLIQIDYLAAKAHIENGKMCRFYHELGEATGEVPTLWIDKDGMPVIIGGNYDVWKSGIVN